MHKFSLFFIGTVLHRAPALEVVNQEISMTKNGDYITKLKVGSNQQELAFKVDLNTDQIFIALDSCKVGKNPCTDSSSFESESS